MVSEIEPVARPMLYQVGTMHSLLSGVDEGDLTYGELAHYGNFGLGTFDRISGEMVAVDGYFFRIDAAGRARPVSPEVKTPFAMITRFMAGSEFNVDPFETISDFEADLIKRFHSPNIIYAIKVTGRFNYLKLRSEHPQPAGHQPLANTLADLQTTFEYDDLSGTLLGFWFPHHLGIINFPGFHFHFIDRDHQCGGHVFQAAFGEVRGEVMPVYDFGIHLIHTRLFESKDLYTESPEAAKKVEEES